MKGDGEVKEGKKKKKLGLDPFFFFLRLPLPFLQSLEFLNIRIFM